MALSRKVKARIFHNRKRRNWRLGSKQLPITAEERASIQTRLVEKIRDTAYRLYRESGYKVAAGLLAEPNYAFYPISTSDVLAPSDESLVTLEVSFEYTSS